MGNYQSVNLTGTILMRFRTYTHVALLILGVMAPSVHAEFLPWNIPVNSSFRVGYLYGSQVVSTFSDYGSGLVKSAVEVIRANKDLDLVIQEAHRKWDPARAQKTTAKVLAKFGNQVDAFICNNDRLATGVIAALKERGLDHIDRVFVAGADAALVNIRYIVKGKQTVDVWKMIDPLAETAAEVAVKLARNPGKKITEIIKPDKMVNNGTMEIPTIVTPVKLVTRDNINETLIKGGVYTTNQIYGAEPISENLR